VRAVELRARLGLVPVRLRPAVSTLQPLPGGAWVLREDLAGDTLGGGKLRKLEWLLGETVSGDVITLGPAGGLHLLSAAVVGRARGLRVHAIAWPQRWLPISETNLRALHAHAETVWPARSRGHAMARLARVWATVRVQAGEPPAVWGPGGSDAAGTLAWAEAGLELVERAAAGEFVMPPRLVVAQGSGGTAAGLQLGLALGGATTEVYTVDVTGFGAALVRTQSECARRRLEAAGVPVPTLPPLRVQAAPNAYAVPDSAAGRAAVWAADHGFTVDPVYSGPALAGALATGEPFLFVATANGHALDPLLRSALPELPPRLRALWS
jgi:D-cysteine desulfhydrase